jgi:hypothetical protein
MENEEEERFRFLETINAVCTNEEWEKKRIKIYAYY